MISYDVIAFDTQGNWVRDSKVRRTLQTDEIRVKIHAFGINRADLLQKAGYYPAPSGVAQNILGLEFAGEVIETVSNHSAWQIGDRVMGICAGESYAQEIIMPSQALLPIADHWTWAQAAAIPEAYLTAFDALFSIADLQEQAHVLIHAIGSGVGLAAARLAHWKGAIVHGSSRSQWKLDKANQVTPFVHTILSTDQYFLNESIKNQMNVIIDFIGASYLQQNLKALAQKGHLVVVGLLGGTKAELPLGLLLAKRAKISGTVLRSREQQEKNNLIQKFAHEVLPALQSNQITIPEVHQVFQVDQIQKAHRLLAENQTWSKVVVQWEMD